MITSEPIYGTCGVASSIELLGEPMGVTDRDLGKSIDIDTPDPDLFLMAVDSRSRVWMRTGIRILDWKLRDVFGTNQPHTIQITDNLLQQVVVLQFYGHCGF